jgi:glucokinase
VVQIAANAQGSFAVGVDVGGTNIRAGVITREGKKLAEARRPARAMEGLAITQQMIIEVAEEAMAKAGVARDALMGLGLGVPGRHQSDEGIVLYSPNFAGWADVNLLRRIEEHFQVGAFMRNDVKTASMGEYYFGAGKGYRFIGMITLGTGIGGSLIYDGKLLLGSSEGFAEVGHMTVDPNGRRCACGNHGCWEAMASRDAIIERAIRKLQTGQTSLLSDLAEYDLGKITPALIAQAAGQGDALATEVFEETGMWVGIGVANLIQLFNPEIFIIGGGISQAGELLFAPIRNAANWRGKMVPATQVKIVPAALGDDAGIFGGAVLVFDAVR